MKNGKKPTRQQRKMLEEKGLNTYNWFVIKDTTTDMTVEHRHTDTVRIIRKG